MNWVKCDDRWMNFDMLTEIWVKPDAEVHDHYIIVCHDTDECTYPLFDRMFETMEKANYFLDRFMESNFSFGVR